MKQDPEEQAISEWLKIVDKPLTKRGRDKKIHDQVIDNNIEQDTKEQQ